MKQLILDSEYANKDITPILVGEERCAPSHTFGPYIRDYFIIHIILSGKGVLIDKYGEK